MKLKYDRYALYYYRLNKYTILITFIENYKEIIYIVINLNSIDFSQIIKLHAYYLFI